MLTAPTGAGRPPRCIPRAPDSAIHWITSSTAPRSTRSPSSSCNDPRKWSRPSALLLTIRFRGTEPWCASPSSRRVVMTRAAGARREPGVPKLSVDRCSFTGRSTAVGAGQMDVRSSGRIRIQVGGRPFDQPRHVCCSITFGRMRLRTCICDAQAVAAEDFATSSAPLSRGESPSVVFAARGALMRSSERAR